MSKHTPGPWELLAIVGVGGARQCAFIGQANDEKGIDRLTDEYAVALVPLTNDESHANARLIAAAPDLLEALKVAEHALVATHNLRATDLDVETFSAHLGNDIDRSFLEWMTDNSTSLSVIRSAIAKATGAA